MDRRSGEERRAGRLVYSRGPIIRTLELVSALAGLLAVIGLVISLTAQNGRIDSVQTSRFRAAEDSCLLLRGLVFAATPHRALARANAYITATSLRDCTVYAHKVIATP